MAFVGTPVVKQVADGLVRITGLSLVDATSGTIGLFESAADPALDVRLPEGFKARGYSRPDGDVALQDCVEVDVAIAEGPGTQITLGVEKTGTTPEDFQIEVFARCESDEGPAPTGALEIYVRYH